MSQHIHPHLTQQHLLRPVMDQRTLNESEPESHTGTGDVRRPISAQRTQWPGKHTYTLCIFIPVDVIFNLLEFLSFFKYSKHTQVLVKLCD